MKTIYFLLAASFVSFTGCNEKQQSSTSGQPSSAKNETREGAVILKENGDLRVKPLQGMDLVKDAPQAPVVPVDVQVKSDNNVIFAASTESIHSKTVKPVHVMSSQSPMMRASIRTQAMDEMARRKSQAAENQK